MSINEIINRNKCQDLIVIVSTKDKGGDLSIFGSIKIVGEKKVLLAFLESIPKSLKEKG